MLEQLDTPAMLIDREIMDRNLRRMQERVASHGMALAPHIKTHKNPEIAARQRELGARRIMVSKLGEAEVFLEAGFHDQFIGYPLVGASAMERLGHLMTRGLRPVVAVDSPLALEGLLGLSDQRRATIGVMLEVDTGFRRAGLADPRALLALAERARGASLLRIRGITAFGGHIGAGLPREVLVERIRRQEAMLGEVLGRFTDAGWAENGFEVSLGGTVPTGYLEELRVATELRPGTYVFHDASTVDAGAATLEDVAATMLTTVVSCPAPDRAVIDAGSKTLSSDGPLSGSYGLVQGRPDLAIERLSEEHGVLRARDGGRVHLDVGQRLRIIPHHVCPMVNLHDLGYWVRGDEVEGLYSVMARGRVR